MWPTPVTLLALLLLATSSLCSTSSPNKSPSSLTVRVKNGTYRGIHLPQYNQDFFLGVPYAQAPVADLRFRQAQSLNAAWTGSRDVTTYRPLCVGYGLDQLPFQVSEDCLYLNIIRPTGYTSENLPIGFWIHGGGFTNGGGADQRYNLSFIVDQSVKIGKPFIGVSISYRLHAWGFLHSDEVVGEGLTNMGLRDQRLALHWVRENIAAFGGDPSKVTIWGESAGAASVGHHLTAYNGRNDHLFRAAILQSGNPIFYTDQRGTHRSQPLFNRIVSETNCSTSLNKIQCLRKTPYMLLNSAINATYQAGGTFAPTIDGDIIATHGSLQLSRGQFVKVPIITGANSDEGASFSPKGINTTADFQATLSALPPTFQQAILAAYPDDLTTNVVASLGTLRPAAPYGSQFRRSATYWGDVYFIASRRATAQTWAAAGLPAYSYRFNVIPAGVPPEVAAGHFKEIPWVFRNTLNVGYRPDILPFVGLPQRYRDLATFMSSTWASFISDLDPNAWDGRPKEVGGWKRYGVDAPVNFVFDANRTSYLERDTWRGIGIGLINENAVGVYHR